MTPQLKKIRHGFKLRKENKTIKNRIIRDIWNLFEHEEDYYKPVKAGSFWSNDYIEYESNSDRKKHYQLKNILIKLDHT